MAALRIASAARRARSRASSGADAEHTREPPPSSPCEPTPIDASRTQKGRAHIVERSRPATGLVEDIGHGDGGLGTRPPDATASTAQSRRSAADTSRGAPERAPSASPPESGGRLAGQRARAPSFVSRTDHDRWRSRAGGNSTRGCSRPSGSDRIAGAAATESFRTLRLPSGR